MLVKDEYAKYGLRLGEQLEHINNIISTLALTNYLKVDKEIHYY